MAENPVPPAGQVPGQPQYVPVTQVQVPAGVAPGTVLVPAAQYPPQPAPAPAPAEHHREHAPAEVVPEKVRLYSHSTLFYWWPVWAVGFLLAFLSYAQGQPDPNAKNVIIHPSSNLGIIYFTVLFLVILITNTTARGMASVVVVISLLLVVVVLAYFKLWDILLEPLKELKIYVNTGAYFWFSAVLFVVWVLTVFIFDHLEYWEIKPGQMTHVQIFGSGSSNYDTRNMVFQKLRNDLFRHWMLGLGAGDVHIRTFGARQEEIDIPNVLFVGAKVDEIQKLIVTHPEEFGVPQVS